MPNLLKFSLGGSGALPSGSGAPCCRKFLPLLPPETSAKPLASPDRRRFAHLQDERIPDVESWLSPRHMGVAAMWLAQAVDADAVLLTVDGLFEVML